MPLNPDEQWWAVIPILCLVLGLYEAAVDTYTWWFKRPARIAAMRKRLDDAD